MPKTTDKLLEATNLGLPFGGGAGVHELSLALRPGDILGLLGLNGAGKSTTLRLLAGLLVPATGSVSIDGYELSDEPLKARARLGYLPDQPPLYDDMRVRDYLQLAARLRRVPKTRLADRVEQVISQCDLHDVEKQRIGRLSKGYRQRVGLAQAIVHEPAVLLLDEPSNGLDPQQMQGMREIIRNIGKRNAIVFSTHLLHEAQAVCNRIAMLHHGQLVHQCAVNANENQNIEALFNSLLHEQHAEQHAGNGAAGALEKPAA